MPLGPGFYVHKEELEVRFLPGDPPRLEVLASFELENSGNAPLVSLDALLPAEQLFGRTDLRVTVAGREVASEPLPPRESTPPFEARRIPIAPAWPEKERRMVTIAYRLTARSEHEARIGMEANSFFVRRRGWYPLLKPPPGLFAKGGDRPKVWELRVHVPGTYLVHASGAPRGLRRHTSETEHRFRIAAEDFAPFVVAGEFRETRVKVSGVEARYWTHQPLPENSLAVLLRQLAASARFFEASFGPRARHPKAIHVVESAALTLSQENPAGVAAASLPEAAIIHPSVREQDASHASTLHVAELMLAGTWFSHVSEVENEEDTPLTLGMSFYAARLAAEQRSDAEPRGAYLARLIRAYDQAVAREGATAAAEQTPHGSPHPLSERIKAILFLFALEEHCGPEALRSGTRRMVQALRGSAYGYAELRAALEAESRRDLGEIFRQWLNRPNLPADFRSRHLPHATPQ